jgi:ubiquinone/menaquinone biosynthesis C-methylase UbiE
MKDDIAAYFDSLADRWDRIAVHPAERVERMLDVAGNLSGLSVLDVGSGTGVLIEPLLERVGPEGGVLALDLSPRMIATSRRAHSAANLDFIVADFTAWAPSGRFDLVVAYSCYPHFLDQGAFWTASRRCLSQGGRVLVAHIEGRAAINALHGVELGSISRHLEPVGDLSRIASGFGFETIASRDDDEGYSLLAGIIQ